MIRASTLRRFALSTVLAAVFLIPSGSVAEIYKWKDAQGRLHFAQDLSQVPPQHRKQAESSAARAGARPEIQRYNAAPAPSAAARPKSRSKRSAAGYKSTVTNKFEIRVPKSGNSMRVMVELNDHIKAPFIIDTGATDVVLPYAVAEQLGIDLESARTQYYRTANGVVESKVTVLESVNLGGARVENVPASVSKSMSIGLLGLSFFNHFRYNVDAAKGIITLEENGQADAGNIRGGRSQTQWRTQYRRLNARRAAIEKAADESSSNGARRKREIEDALEEAERQIEVLDDEADEARVPMRWRD